MKHLLLYIACSCFVLAGGQTIPLFDTIPVPEGSRITSDNLQNLFVITPTNDIIKYDKDGKKTATVNFKVLGNVTSIDVSFPFDIYVFYRDQNKIIILDNMLNSKGEMDLESIGVSQVACVCRSSDNQLWLFDMSDLKLKKYSRDLKLMIESASFNNFNLGTDISPAYVIDASTSIFLLDRNRILEFDVFANFNKIKLIDTLQAFQYIKEADSTLRFQHVIEKIVFLKNNKIYTFNPLHFTMQEMNIILPPNTKNIRIEKERLYVLTDEYVILKTFSQKKD